MISPSRIYTQASGVNPITSMTAMHDSWCVMCGVPVTTGTPCNLLTAFGPTFNNALDLRAPSGRYICGDCQALRGKEWLQTYSKTYACAQGFFKLASNEDCAAFVLTPPEPPFVAINSTTQQQHLIWRAPVCLSRDLILIRMGDEVLSIRRALALRALLAYRDLMTLMATTPHPALQRLLTGPAANFNRELVESRMGSVRLDVIELALANGMHDRIECLAHLSMGEWWALNALRFADLDHPPAPVRLTYETPAARKARKAAEADDASDD